MTPLADFAREHWPEIYVAVAMLVALAMVRRVETTRDRIAFVVFAPLWLPVGLLFWIIVKVLFEVILDALFD